MKSIAGMRRDRSLRLFGAPLNHLPRTEARPVARATRRPAWPGANEGASSLQKICESLSNIEAPTEFRAPLKQRGYGSRYLIYIVAAPRVLNHCSPATI